eukprot:849900_1
MSYKSLKHIISPDGVKLFPPFYTLHPVIGGKYHLFKGEILDGYKSTEMLEHLQSTFTTTENDIIIASFWKAGSHLLKNILLQIIQNSQSIKQKWAVLPDD